MKYKLIFLEKDGEGGHPRAGMIVSHKFENYRESDLVLGHYLTDYVGKIYRIVSICKDNDKYEIYCGLLKMH